MIDISIKEQIESVDYTIYHKLCDNPYNQYSFNFYFDFYLFP